MVRSISDILDTNNIKFYVVSTVDSLFRVLDNLPEVQQLADDIKDKIIQESEVRDYVASCLRELQTGYLLPRERELCAVIMAVYKAQPDFAIKFLESIALLECREMPFASKLAEKCRQILE